MTVVDQLSMDVPEEELTVELAVPALRVRQSPGRHLYLFAVDGKRLQEFATVSRVRRDEDKTIEGYQRPEVLRHIRSIQKYLESDEAMIPNALVIAFDERVTFTATLEDDEADSVPGVLTIPINPIEDETCLPGFVVDGQQRMAAIRDANVDRFPMSVVSFIAKSDAEQRAQFILVNATKPLPKSLIYELLPSTEGHLPDALAKRQLPSALLERMNLDEDSALQGMIQTPTTPGGVVKDNSILKVLESSISDGALYRFRDPETGQGDIELMLRVLKPFWKAVKRTFEDDWGLPPRKSRLMHGAGIVSLGYLMDAIADQILDDRLPTVQDFEAGLGLIAPLCAWSTGEWDFGGGQKRAWNDLQNIPRDVQMLTSYLAFEFRKLDRPK